MSIDGRVLVFDATSSTWRRDLGASAWAVFEELLLVSTGPVDRCEAMVSVRSLATCTGLAKDTVARALRRLRGAGLIEVHQSRTAGVFSTGCYRLHLPVGVSVEDRSCPAGPALVAALSGSRLVQLASSPPTLPPFGESQLAFEV